MKFINRAGELQQLNEGYQSDHAEFAVIYGRRRVGKTTLIEKFVESKPHLYFLADESNETILLKTFAALMAETFQKDFIKNITFENWDSAFDFLLERVSSKKKFILVIDEFQYIGKANKAFPSILQRIWDKKLKRSNIFLIISGSIISMMKSQVLKYDSPLYGRRTIELKCSPLLFEHSRKFFPHLSREKQIEFYAVSGGVPKYLELFNENISIFKNIQKRILKKGVLYEEPKHLLKDEVKETLNYFSVLKAIAFGNRKMKNICSYLALPSSKVTPFLETLIDMQILKRDVPITEKKPEKSKKGLYFFQDYFFHFWFQYVLPYKSYLEIEKTDIVMKKIQQSFDSHVSFIFEDIAKEYIWKHIPFFMPEKVGKWWNKNQEINLVAINDEKKKILFGECKWSNKKVGVDILKDLQKKSLSIYDYEKKYFILFSKKGFSEKLKQLQKKEKNVMLIEASKMF